MFSRLSKLRISRSKAFSYKLFFYAFIILVICSFIIKKTSHYALKTSDENYNTYIRQIISIKDQTQNMSLSIPNSVYTGNRRALQKIIHQDLPIVKELKESLISLHLNADTDFLELPILEQERINQAYQLISQNLELLIPTLEELQIAPELEDIGSYLQTLQSINENLTHFPDFTKKQLLLKPFSLK